jgi:hypothetical protein
MRIVILVEHVERELLFALLLRKRLGQIGHKVLICNMFFDFSLIKLFKPDIVFLPYFYRGSDPSINHFFEITSVKRFYSLSWEQIFNQIQINTKTPKQLHEKLTLISWSNSWKNYLVRSGIEENKIIQLGHPMWSIYWRYPFKSTIYSGWEKNRKLYIENLDWLGSNESKFKAFQLSSSDSKDLEDLSILVRNIIRIFHKNTFDIKVRPSSTLKRDLNLKRFLFRARLVRGLPLIYYLKKTTLCFGDFSSGLIDSFLLGIPTSGVGIGKIPKPLAFMWQSFFEKSQFIKGRRVEEIYTFKSNELLNYLINDGYINPNYINDFIEKLNLVKKVKVRKIEIIRGLLFHLILSLTHILYSFPIFRKTIYKRSRSNLDLKTHSQDFNFFKQFFIYRKLAKSLDCHLH